MTLGAPEDAIFDAELVAMNGLPPDDGRLPFVGRVAVGIGIADLLKRDIVIRCNLFYKEPVASSVSVRPFHLVGIIGYPLVVGTFVYTIVCQTLCGSCGSIFGQYIMELPLFVKIRVEERGGIDVVGMTWRQLCHRGQFSLGLRDGAQDGLR